MTIRLQAIQLHCFGVGASNLALYCSTSGHPGIAWIGADRETHPPLNAPTGFLAGNGVATGCCTTVSRRLELVWKVRRKAEDGIAVCCRIARLRILEAIGAVWLLLRQMEGMIRVGSVEWVGVVERWRGGGGGKWWVWLNVAQVTHSSLGSMGSGSFDVKVRMLATRPFGQQSRGPEGSNRETLITQFFTRLQMPPPFTSLFIFSKCEGLVYL